MTKPVPAALCFTEFCRTVLGFKHTPAQLVHDRVVYDGVEPADLEGEQRALARQMFGNVETIPAIAREVSVQVKGARIGGTLRASYRRLHLALTLPLPSLAPGEWASAPVIAPDLRLARQALRFDVGAVKRVPALAALLEQESSDSYVLRRPDGHCVVSECLPAARGGTAGRGRSLVCVHLSEACFFRDRDFVVNDEEIYRAVAPRVIPGGQVIIESTPWAASGLVHGFFERDFGKCSTALVSLCRTDLMRPDRRTRAMVARERERNPDNARREFDAEFMAANASSFFDPRAIKTATVETLPLPAPPPKLDDDEPEELFAFATDLGFRRNSSALAGVKRDADDLYTVVVLEERIPDGAPLKPSVVCSDFARIAKGYGIDSVLGDEHYRETVAEHLEAAGLYLVPAPGGATGKADVYVAARTLLHENRVRLPNHERLLRQLREVFSRPLAGGGISVESPTWKSGAHGDLVSALVLALWHASRQPKPERQPAPPTDADRLRAESEARKQKLIERAQRRANPDDDDWILDPYR